MSRRTFLAGSGALALGTAAVTTWPGSAATAATTSTSPAPAASTSSAADATFYKGADISWFQQMEAHGYYWNNAGGTRQDIFAILKGYGLSAIRFRTFVNPSSDPANGHCSINEVAAMAVRARDAGMAVNIDYHFGDTWNSVGVQNPPAAWKNMSYTQMRSAISSYVNQTMNVIKSNSVTPTWVQIGNEINSGICHPVGTVSNPSQMTGLLNAAHDAVKQVFPDALVMIHLAQPQKYDSMVTFYNGFAGNGGKWDMNGFSSYGSASLADGIVANMKRISDAHGKPYMQVEAGGPVSKATSTRDTIEAYLRALLKYGGQGLLYWEPEGYSPFTGYANVAWNSSTRRPTVIMDAFPAVDTGPGGGGGGGGTTTYVRLRNAQTGLYVDGEGRTSNGSNAGQHADSTSTNQQWSIEADGSYVRIKNRATGLYLDGLGATTNGSAAGQWSDTNSTNQQWTQASTGSTVRFRNRATGLYLDGMGRTSNDADLGQYSDTGSTNQQWTTVNV